jgi:hypothetical protein
VWNVVWRVVWRITKTDEALWFLIDLPAHMP